MEISGVDAGMVRLGVHLPGMNSPDLHKVLNIKKSKSDRLDAFGCTHAASRDAITRSLVLSRFIVKRLTFCTPGTPAAHSN